MHVLLAHDQGKANEAMELYRKRVTIVEALGYKARMSECYTNMGIVATNRGQFDEALLELH